MDAEIENHDLLQKNQGGHFHPSEVKPLFA
jgi:hypothetical protein